MFDRRNLRPRMELQTPGEFLNHLTPSQTATAAMLAATLFAPRPLRWLLAFAGGFVLGQSLRQGQAARERRSHRRPPEWISDPKPDHTGRLNDETLVHAASEDSFPASDPPSYTTGRGSNSVN